jgi:hypothetical protein
VGKRRFVHMAVDDQNRIYAHAHRMVFANVLVIILPQGYPAFYDTDCGILWHHSQGFRILIIFFVEIGCGIAKVIGNGKEHQCSRVCGIVVEMACAGCAFAR